MQTGVKHILLHCAGNRFAIMEKPVWKVSILQVNALIHAVQSFPAHTPKRWMLVSEFVNLATAYEDGVKGTFIQLQIPTSKNSW